MSFSKATLLILMTTICLQLSSQSKQAIRGIIQDSESLISLPGATVIIKDTEPLVGTSADADGHFLLENIATGRVSLLIRMIGYEDAYLDHLMLTSGKELHLEVKLNPSFEQLNEVVIKAQDTDGQALNEMATLSARSFSVEETQRYAASAFDPARMAASFAGVAQASDNIENLITVRGNSPRGILWRLEGIEIPNPNHFGDLGSSGGGISMMSSSTLSSSDFYTGAFPSEFGNATSGVFDINFRNGNSEVREHSIMFGALGLEVASEGYFSAASSASYLINYRYSTLSLLSLVYQPLGDVAPVYQDISFKVSLPDSPLGAFSIFGLAGDNFVDIEAKLDSSEVDTLDELDGESYRSTQRMGVIGVKHLLRLNDNMFLKTVVAHSINRYTDESYEHDLFQTDVRELYDITSFKDDQSSLHSSLHYKVNARNTLRFGAIVTLKQYDLNYDNKDIELGLWTNYIKSEGNLEQYEHYGHWKHRLSTRLTSHLGYHLTYLPFNSTSSIEPRAAMTFETTETSQLSLAVGLHSKPEHVSTYFLDQVDMGESGTSSQNQSLAIPKSLHTVIGYKLQVSPKLNASAEAYFQYQFDLPLEELATSSFSTVNSTDIWDLVGRERLVSQGIGRNYGLDLTLSKPFQDGLYVMTTGSLYKSEYRTYAGDWFQTRFSGNYVANVLAGKEFKMKKKNRILGVNLKGVISGGLRETPIDIMASALESETVRPYEDTFTERVGEYFRFDVGFSYKVNRDKLTHTVLFDIQNVSNRLNVQGRYFDTDEQQVVTYYQTGLFPFINYRLEFQGKRKRMGNEKL